MVKKITAFMNSYSHGKSGGDMVFIETAKRLKRVRWEIVTSSLGKSLCIQDGVNARYIITSAESEFKNIISIYIRRTITAIARIPELLQTDAILGTSDFLPDTLPLYLLKWRKPKIMWIQHIFHVIPPTRKIPYHAQRLSFFLIRHRADRIVVDNKILMDDLITRGFDKSKITVNYPGIDLPYLKSVKKLKKKSFDCVCLAQIRPSKGIPDLVDIWREVCRSRPHTQLAIIGKGNEDYINAVRNRINDANLAQNIYLLGYLENDAAFSTIKSSRIFVFPSHEEGFGIAALEAQALGLPVVAWDLPVFGEIFQGGMMRVKLKSIKEFARELIVLLNDEKKYRRMSEAAVRNAEQYSWDKTARREESLL